MKKKLFILLILLLVLSVGSVAYLQWGPVPAWLIDGISVSSAESESPVYHPLTREEAQGLAESLNDTVLPKSDAMAAERTDTELAMALHLKVPFKREYTLNISPDQHLLLHRSGRESMEVALNPTFFLYHPAFTTLLYPQARFPQVQLIGLEEPFPPSQSIESWEYQRWDDTWVQRPSLTIPSVESTIVSPTLTQTNRPLYLNIEPAPDTISLRLTDPAGSVRHDGLLESTALPLFPYNGRHEYTLTLHWEGLTQPYRGTATAHFNLDMDLPVAFEAPGPNAVQGEMLAFRARHVPEGAEVVLQQNLISGPVTLFPLEDGYVAYFPTHYGNQPGEYRLSYGLQGEALQESTLTLHARGFHIQYLSISASVAAATRNEEAAAMTARYFTPSRDNSAPERYYTEDFVIPVRGRLTTEFGETRYVNNAPTSYRHSGLDIAAPTGTPIAAVNRGRVVLAMELITQGNTVVIDHGQGLFSVYFHMHELSTTADRIVERGETIGTVGTTGFSTGPHLHFTMSYYRHNLEPGHFLAGEPITYQNAAHHLAP